ncbi:S-methyl-5'-thioadenosine phosphorylase [Synechococcus sp. BSF8S]|uniref:S-methyl-5'-thioadenosine phosphorylase n=1 Tax=Synechococcales TaxID=1890424 RepID=UPI001627A0FC|nr:MULTISPECIES: S-methyl-5'-thioadenosine phosphorylase [unclassified Synechococcus]MBC1260218.1 S-methyl-5'-thioadenosine phosphorylase [Synechococcus sp. BSF8S]MBC1262965.1 S-methyl-5'-thioadenosine phosphorylase [Synechococcus sp. BSA11S]MCT0248499.1 S-methyl-5'-thioadenosine phosphorylase [Synechococcus sp. CS-205]
MSPNAPTSSPGLDLGCARLGVLGGSGLYAIDGLEDVRELTVDTPFGPPSDTLRLGRIGTLEVVFLARHGRHHTHLPTEVPYRANLWALRSLGVRWILSCSAVGSLQDPLRPLDMVVPDQFIDRTHARPVSFFGDGAVAHVGIADPFCPSLSRLLADVAESLMPAGRQLHRRGTYLCMEGPAFSTRAESNLYRSWGCSVIGMTNHSEARLAREAEIAYATLAMVTDYDCWHADHASVTVDLVIENLRANAALAQQIVAVAAERIDAQRPASSSHSALRDALMTPVEQVPAATRRKLDLFTSPYWGPFETAPTPQG